jgi:predicted Zn-dependent protease
MGLAREHPGFVAAWVSAGDRLRDNGKPVRARRIWERGARVRPAAVLLERIAALDTAGGHPEQTTKTLDRLRRRHPADAGLTAAIVRHHLRADALDRAAAALATVPADAPADPVLEALRGDLARRRGDTVAAAEHLAHAAAEYLDPREMRCRACGQTAPAWSARCARCGRWDTLEPPGCRRPRRHQSLLFPSKADLRPRTIA